MTVPGLLSVGVPRYIVLLAMGKGGSVPFRYGVLLLGRYARIFAPRNVFCHVKIVPLVESCNRPLFCYVIDCLSLKSKKGHRSQHVRKLLRSIQPSKTLSWR